MKKIFCLIFIFLCLFAAPSFAQDENDTLADWEKFGDNVDKSFFYVLSILTRLQVFFTEIAWFLGQIVFIIAVSLAALNYALTGQGLKDNIVKIGKAVIFFLIIMVGYPRIIIWISDTTFSLSYNSLGADVQAYFNETVKVVTRQNIQVITGGSSRRVTYAIESNSINTRTISNYETKSFYREFLTDTNQARDERNLFGNLTSNQSNFSVISPATLLRVVFLIAGECWNVANRDNSVWKLGSTIANTLKGVVMCFFVIATGVFATIEYIVCFLEFVLVTSVGIILFPFTIWEGSKFWAEKFVGAVLGFTIKLLFVTLAIFLMAYGYINMFYFIGNTESLEFELGIGEMLFIVFTSVLFFILVKSAPALAQGLLTGTPSLSASGAISAVAGAVGGAMAVGGMAKAAAGKVQNAGAATVGGIAKGVSAAKETASSGGSYVGGFLKGVGGVMGGGLTRSLLGRQNLDSTGSLKANSPLFQNYSNSPSAPNTPSAAAPNAPSAAATAHTSSGLSAASSVNLPNQRNSSSVNNNSLNQGSTPSQSPSGSQNNSSPAAPVP